MSEQNPWVAEVVSVGDELISGAHLDLNASRLARGLLGIGIETKHFSTVPDDQPLLTDALRLASTRARVILVTGGLGPTEDDITRFSAAELLAVPLDFDEPTWKRIVEYMEKRGRKASESNKLCATFPRGVKILPNGAGTAPGFRMNLGKASIYFLPGPPHEAEQMLETHVLPLLTQEIKERSANAMKRLHLFGPAESTIGEKIAERMKRGKNPRVGTTVRKGVTTINIFARAETAAKAKEIVDREAGEIRSLFGDAVFGEDGITLPEALGKLLIEKKISLTSAESCTGGLIGKLLTDVPGISAVYRGGVITYSNQMKNAVLGVTQIALDQHGAVSEEVARQMAEGAAKLNQVDLAIAVTGIAGPDGGTAEKPVGLVYEAVCFKGKTTVEKRIYPPGDRKRIRELAARDTLNLARLRLLAK